MNACVPFVMAQKCVEEHPSRILFRHAASLRSHGLIKHCFALYTTLAIMRNGWEFADDQTLGMSVIRDEQSAWHGQIPVPRMVQNQLGHQLELHMHKLDGLILKGLLALMTRQDPSDWRLVTLITFLVLYIREIDAGRNIYWSRYQDSVRSPAHLFSLFFFCFLFLFLSFFLIFIWPELYLGSGGSLW